MGNFLNELNKISEIHVHLDAEDIWRIAIQMHLETLTKVFQSPFGLAGIR